MTRKELPARAANIQRAIASASTCNRATVDALQAFLLPAQSSNSIAPEKCGRATISVSTAAPRPKAAGERARKRPAVTILEIPEEASDRVHVEERFALAIEVVNTTLKSLSSAIKDPPKQTKKTPLRRTSSSGSFAPGIESRSQTPLQSICVNRLVTSSSENVHKRRSSSTASGNETYIGLRSLAECGRLAFATLRLLQGHPVARSMPPLQLESGMSALIGRLITLGFEDIALKELYILRRRLDTSNNASLELGASKSVHRSTQKTETQPKTDTLVELLKFNNVDANGHSLALIITTQLQILKLLAAKRDPRITEAAFQHLGLDVAYSPANMIQRQIEPNSQASRDKAAQQLESLAQTMTALCPGVSPVEDHSSNCLFPHIAFEFQLLAIRLRSIWWKISGHQVNISMEVVEPISRCLAAFHRRSKMNVNHKYDIATAAFDLVTDYTYACKGYEKKPLLAVYQILADLAQEGAKHSEAIGWLNRSIDIMKDCEISQIRSCSLSCRLASLQMRTFNANIAENTLDYMKVAAGGLAGSLQGDSAELDELLIHVVSLRRSSVSMFQDSYKASNTDPARSSSPLVDECLVIVLLCLKFVLRYIGSEPGQGGSQKLRARRDQRRRLAAKVSDPMIESVVLIARLSAKTTMEKWTEIQAGLLDSVSLALTLRDIHDSNKQISSEAKPESSCFVLISNAYWYRHLYLKREPIHVGASRECIRKSIDILKYSNPLEQVTGLLPLKVEKYAKLCESMRDYKRAAEAYQEALQAHIDTGLLQSAINAADTRSLPHALECGSELEVLSTVLLAYPKAAIKADIQQNPTKAYFDDERLCTKGRGVLLEQQLISVLGLFQDLGPLLPVSRAVNSLAKLLLTLYTETEFPIRRLRVVVRLLGSVSMSSNILDEDLRNLLEKTTGSFEETHSDQALLQHLPFLCATHDLLWKLCQRSLDLKSIESVAVIWSKILHDYSDWDSLHKHVYDMSEWLSQLEITAQYLDMQGLELTRVSVLHVLVTVHEAAKTGHCCTLVSKLSALGVQYVRLGYSGAAATVLRKAQRYLETSDVPAEIEIRWHLSHAEHTIANGNFKACRGDLERAQVLFDDGIASKGKQRTSSKDQSLYFQLIADAYSLHSLLASAEGHSLKALCFARLAVKNIQRSWNVLDRSKCWNKRSDRAGNDRSVNEALLEPLSDLSIKEGEPVKRTEAYVSLSGAAFWGVVPRLFHGFTYLCGLYAHLGLFAEVRYYLGQAGRMADAVQSPSLTGRHLHLLGQSCISGGEAERGLQYFRDAETALASVPHSIHYIRLQLSMAVHHAKHNCGQGLHSGISVAEQTLQNLMTKTFLDTLVYKQPASDDLVTKLDALRLQAAKPVQQSASKGRRAVSKKALQSISTIPRDVTDPLTEVLPTIEAITLSRIRGDIFRERGLIAFCEASLDSATTLLKKAASFPSDQHNIALQALLASRIRCQRGLEYLASDPVFCVLPESTISCPSVRSINERQPQRLISRKPQRNASSVPSRNNRSKGLTSKTRPESPSLCESEVDLLRLAQAELGDISKVARKYSSTSTLHGITSVLGKVSMILSATSSSASRYPVSPTFLVYVLEAGRLLSMARGTIAIQTDDRLSQDKITYDWPRDDAEKGNDSNTSHQEPEFATFQADYIDIIPRNWTAISMTLSESREEILICKIRAGMSPFVLRLPLSRSNSLESDEESFDFGSGKAEMQDIIRLTNESTHGAQDLSGKGAKTRWWEIRTALDARLKDLLANIESIWLGGFKGIFSQEVVDENLVARLQQSLQNILDKHLPSRQKSGRGAQSSRVNLDQRVLELFIGLGCPSEMYDIDEPLTDLLYFVIDILQFNGERNAYDEVDLDSIAIETTDALRQYHMALGENVASNVEQHSILILDRHLHCFPWESLPCLSGRAVTRLPSLGCLRDRILRQQQSQRQEEIPSTADKNVCVSRNSGAYVLNPGGDLISTQSKFQCPLRDLSGWDTVVEREPLETEMKTFLENREIVLYFGHGSGSQYISPRTIKRLNKCAVALLMGCSSGALTEAEDFESYGTPINYMHAGSPAVLATLWDVTDKDIDRFSHTVLEKWGLFGENGSPVNRSPVKKSGKQEGKSKIPNVRDEERQRERNVSLDEAVAQGRDSCILKYLNGAAPVVYGVPVFLA